MSHGASVDLWFVASGQHVPKKLRHGATVCQFWEAQVFGAQVCGAQVCGAQVVGAQVVGAQVVGAQVVGAQVVGAQVGGAQVVGAQVRGAQGKWRERCLFHNVRVRYLQLAPQTAIIIYTKVTPLTARAGQQPIL